MADGDSWASLHQDELFQRLELGGTRDTNSYEVIGKIVEVIRYLRMLTSRIHSLSELPDLELLVRSGIISSDDCETLNLLLTQSDIIKSNVTIVKHYVEDYHGVTQEKTFKNTGRSSMNFWKEKISVIFPGKAGKINESIPVDDSNEMIDISENDLNYLAEAARTILEKRNINKQHRISLRENAAKALKEADELLIQKPYP